MLWVLLPHRIVDLVSTNDEAGSILLIFFIAYILDKGTISDILSSGSRDVLLSDELDCVGGILYATSDSIGQTSKFIC